MKIVNGKKFVTSMCMVLFMIIGISLLISNSSFSYSPINYKKIAVIDGDTLWNIAQQEKEYNNYYQNKDVRDIIANIKQLNNMNNSNIFEGQELVIPTM